MAHKARNTTGASLRERAAVARRMTAEQQRAAREASDAARSAALASGSRRSKRKTSGEGGAKERPSSARDGRVSKRSAKSENFKESSRKRTSSRSRTPRASVALGTPAKVGLVLLVVLVAIGAILYQPAKSYYQALRTEQHDQAVLEATNARNDELQKRNDELKTDEGVENQARKEFGWTKENENAAVISNVDSEDDADTAVDLPEQVEPEDVEAPQTWYYRILDVLFFVKQ